MRRLFVMLFVLSGIAPLAMAQDGSEARPFSISSFNTPFAMQGEFEGEYRVYPDRIRLRVTKTHIRLSEHCPYKGRRVLEEIKFDLATHTEGKKWNTIKRGQSFLLGELMRPGDQLRLSELYFDILIDDSIDLDKHWLVVQMGETSLDLAATEPRKGFSFAHSCRDIFTRDQYASARQPATRGKQ